jgi:simple sugar transport system substrate-binding protein
MNYMEKVSKQFPKVTFMHATGYKTGPNFGIYNARFYEGRYLNGVIAGKMTKSNIIGYVAAFPIPEVLQGINAYTLGARSVNPQGGSARDLDELVV